MAPWTNDVEPLPLTSEPPKPKFGGSSVHGRNETRTVCYQEDSRNRIALPKNGRLHSFSNLFTGSKIGGYYSRRNQRSKVSTKVATSIAQLISEATGRLDLSGVPDARLDAGSLLGHVLSRNRTYLISHSDDSVPQDSIDEFHVLVNRRARGEPLQYIVGCQEFFGLDFRVSPAALIPRPETELLVETGIALLKERKQPALICDVGTGSGCIAIAILHHVKHARALATDISAEALKLAKINAERLGVADRISFVLSSCFAAINQRTQFDLIVSNPPYVAEDSLSGLQREVRDFEPRIALTPGGDGLAVIRALISNAPQRVRTGGHLLLEIGFDQRERVLELVQPQFWKLLEVYQDLQGIPRTIVLQRC